MVNYCFTGWAESRRIILYWMSNSSCKDAAVCACSWFTCISPEQRLKILSKSAKFIERSQPRCSPAPHSSLRCWQCTTADINKPTDCSTDCCPYSMQGKSVLSSILTSSYIVMDLLLDALMSSPVISIQNKFVTVCLCVAIF